MAQCSAQRHACSTSTGSCSTPNHCTAGPGAKRLAFGGAAAAEAQLLAQGDVGAWDNARQGFDRLDRAEGVEPPSTEELLAAAAADCPPLLPMAEHRWKGLRVTGPLFRDLATECLVTSKHSKHRWALSAPSTMAWSLLEPVSPAMIPTWAGQAARTAFQLGPCAWDHNPIALLGLRGFPQAWHLAALGAALRVFMFCCRAGWRQRETTPRSPCLRSLRELAFEAGRCAEEQLTEQPRAGSSREGGQGTSWFVPIYERR